MSLSLTDFFILASIIQGFSIGLAILCAPFFRSNTNNYLAGFVLTISALTFLGWQDFDLFWPNYLFTIMWEFLIPVFLFQYFLRVLDHPYLRAPWLPWLYGPFVVIAFFDVLIDLDFSFGLFHLPFSADNLLYDFYDDSLDLFALCWNIFLISWLFRIAWQYRQAPAERRRWLVHFGFAMIVVIIIWLLAFIAAINTQIVDPYAAIWIAMSFLFWWIAYAGVYQLRILEERSEIQELLLRRVGSEQLQPAVPIPAGENIYTDQLIRLMAEDHLYKNPDLGRQMIAEHLAISEGYVTQVMQDSLGVGLVDYVNGYRIAAARQMLSDADFAPYSLEAIGREAGFKSRSAFYEAFKKATGQTPGAYRKRLKTS